MENGPWSDPRVRSRLVRSLGSFWAGTREVIWGIYEEGTWNVRSGKLSMLVDVVWSGVESGKTQGTESKSGSIVCVTLFCGV